MTPSPGAAAEGGIWAGVGVVEHQVRSVEEAGAEMGEEESVATDINGARHITWAGTHNRLCQHFCSFYVDITGDNP